MKKVCCLLVAISCLLLSSCLTYNDIFDKSKERYEYYDYNELIDGLSKVEIVELPRFSYEETVVLKELSYEESLEFLYDYSQIKQYYVVPIIGDPPQPSGVSIKIWYSDGTYDLYSKISSTASLWTQCYNGEDFDNLINKYLN